jgi:thiamine biosynthesis lipoprotein
MIDEVSRFDRAYSRFDENSDLSNLLRAGRLDSPSPETQAMFKFAREMYDATNGVFDISVGYSLEKLGYGYRHDSIDKHQNYWQQISITSEAITVPRGLRLDFGGFGKGWLIDNLVEIIHTMDVNDFIVNGGGDLYVSSSHPIEITLENPREPKTLFGTVNLQNKALAASSTTKRTWHTGEQTHHHIIDPETKSPSSSQAIASFVTSRSALIADTLATTLIIRPELESKLHSSFEFDVTLI